MNKKPSTGKKSINKEASERSFKTSSVSNDKPSKRFAKDVGARDAFKKSYDDKEKPFKSNAKDKDSDRVFKKSASSDDRPVKRFSKDGDTRGGFKKSYDKKEKPFKSYSKDSDGEHANKNSESSSERPIKFISKDRRGRVRRNDNDFDKSRSGPNYESERSGKVMDKEWYQDDYAPRKKSFERKGTSKYKSSSKKQKTAADDGFIRLNRYLSNSGICSRREADQLISSGVVKINGKIVTELGTKVGPGDAVQYGDQTLSHEKKRYLLLNKPKNYITTSEDPEGRKTVNELVKNACKERLYPVGRLDRATMGLLLFTNDGDMAKKLTHPSHKVAKLYHVHLDKSLKKGDLLKIANGEVVLEDGVAEVDEITYVGDGIKKDEIGLKIHSGKNRIVRRIFEHLGYKVVKLDRVVFAGLTKKDLPRGKFRFLTEKEVNFLKMI
jgi:23S rRNA pseudouridine2605 synthase